MPFSKPFREYMRNNPNAEYEKGGDINSRGGWEGAFQGGVSGASTGSTFGPWGAFIGGVLGAGAGYISGVQRPKDGDMARSGKGSSNGFTGDKIPKGYSLGQVQKYTPEQMRLHEQQYGYIEPGSYLDRLAHGDESLYAEQEAPALRQFNELQGNMASRFSGAGMGARRSSGFQNQSTAAASNFAQELQAKRQELQRQALGDIMGYSNQILGQQPYDRALFQKPEKPNYWGQIAGQAAQQIPGAVASYYGNKGTGATTSPSSSGSFSAWNSYSPSSSYTPGSGNYNFPQFGGGAF